MIPKKFPPLPSGWQIEPGTFMSHDEKVLLFGNLYTAPSRKNPKTRLAIVLHGMGEHQGRYLHLPHYLQGSIDAMYAYDQRGHGRSEGGRGDARDFDDLAKDLISVIRRWEKKAIEKWGPTEIHLIAHSVGGHVALRSLILDPTLPLASVTVSAPLVGVFMEGASMTKMIKIIAAKLISPILGFLPMNTDLDPKEVCSDPQVVECYVKDPLVHGKMSPRFFTSMLRAMSDTLSCGEGIKPPLFIIIPEKDVIVDSKVTVQFFNGLKHPKKQLKTYPDFFHESLNELKKEMAFEDINAWLKAHSSG